MKSDDMTLDLTGKLLVAMPGMGDSRFDHSVIYMCAHSEEGGMGLIINKPAEDVRMADLFDQLDIDGSNPDAGALPIHFGGPVEHGRGFVLHTRDYSSRIKTLEVGTDFGMTATHDILEDIAVGKGPDKAMMMLGYAGWGPGQLESEIGRNGWLVCDAKLDLVFEGCDTEKWSAALQSMGVDPIGLSASAGHA